MILTLLSFLGITIMVVVLFNILIIVHELGHFLAAKWRGLVVEKFAIWFGKPLWKKEINGVEYLLGTIPAGGYVALPQMAPMESLEGESKLSREEMKDVTPLDKIIVAFAGPLFSFGLALFFALIVWVVGRPVSELSASTTVGYVGEMRPALASEVAPTPENPLPMVPNPVYRAGLRTGDVVVAVDGQPVSKRVGMGDSIMWRFIRSEEDTVPVVVERNGERVELDINPIYQDKKFYQRGALRLSPIPPPIPPLVGDFYPDSPADKAGMQPGDLITAINGQPVRYSSEVIEQVWQHPDTPATYTVERTIGEGAAAKVETLTLTVTPEVPIKSNLEHPVAMLGIAFSLEPRYQFIYPNPIEQLGDSIMAVVNTIDAVISPSSVGVSHLSGPAGIMHVIGRLFSEDTWTIGWRMVLWISVVINVNLALVNLLPLPVLDGGHIMFALYEWVRRKPVNIKVLEALNGATALLLIGFMLYVTFFDVQDFDLGSLFGGGDKEPPIVFAPADAAPTSPDQP